MSAVSDALRSASPVTSTFSRLKGDVKRRLKQLRRRYANVVHPYDAAALRARLAALGVRAGDMLLVHSAYDAFTGFSGKPTDVIAVLEDLVGGNGIVMMPTMPFTGTAVEYVAQHPELDVVRTPSRMGLISELFRRSPGVARSAHPTHPVAIWGAEARAVAAGHHAATTPCGSGSPFARLDERGGKIVFLGADIDSLTFYHYLEEAEEARLPTSPFTRETFMLTTRLPDGVVLQTATRLFEPAVSRRRDLGKLVPELSDAGAWHEARLGGLRIIVIEARAVHDAFLRLAARGVFCYD